MRERDHDDTVEVLDEGETLTEFAMVDQIAHSPNSGCKFVLFYFAFK